MADNSTFDNSVATQRLINSSFNTQTFTNSGTDNSYSLDTTDTNDFFRLRLSQRSSAIVTLTGLTANADLEFLDSSGNTLITSNNGGTLADAITTEVLNPGDYYIRVFLADTSSTNYSLGVSTINTSQVDMFWRNYSGGQNGYWRMNGTSINNILLTTSISDTAWTLEEAADMDSDGIADLIWRYYSTNSSNGQNGVWFMDGNGGIRSTQLLLPLADINWRIAGSGDFNGDGKNDIVWRNYSNFDNAVWFMDGTAFKSAVYLPAMSGNFMQASTVADFDKDGKPDIFWRNVNTGENLIWLMNGTTLKSAVSLTATSPTFDMGGTGDFNGDGNLDLVWRSRTTGDNFVWYMNGTVWNGSSYGTLTPISDQNWRIGSIINSTPIVDLAGNTLATAFNVGSAGGASGSYSDKVGGNNDKNDYYKFSLGGPINFTLSLTGLTAEADVRILKDINNNGVIDSQSEIIATSANTGTLDEQISLQLAAGTYFVQVVSASTTPTYYALNIGGVPAQQVDLAVTPGTNPASFRVTRTNGSALPTQVSLNTGSTDYVSTVRVYYSVRNNSTSVTPPQFRVSFYLSRDNVITTSDRLLGNIDPNTGTSDLDVLVTNLAPGGTSSGFKDVAVPLATDQWWGGDQTYYIGMIIDSLSEVAEVNEINNAVAAAIGIKDTIRPDVIGGSLGTTQTSSSPGQAIRLTGSIKNIGNVSTGSSRILVRYYLSNDDVIDGSDYVIALANIAPLNKRGSTGDTIAFDSNITTTTAPAYFTLQPVLPTKQQWDGWVGNGRYYVAMQIDVFGSVQEGSGGKENNYNYGRLIGQYIDYNFIDITGL